MDSAWCSRTKRDSQAGANEALTSLHRLGGRVFGVLQRGPLTGFVRRFPRASAALDSGERQIAPVNMRLSISTGFGDPGCIWLVIKWHQLSCTNRCPAKGELVFPRVVRQVAVGTLPFRSDGEAGISATSALLAFARTRTHNVRCLGCLGGFHRWKLATCLCTKRRARSG